MRERDEPSARESRGRDDLEAVIRDVRRRWRAKTALRGGAILAAAALLAFVAGSAAMEHFRFSPAAIAATRVAAWTVLAALAAWLVARPLLRRVSDEQVALYVEEHEPSLQAALLSAVGEARREDDARRSPALAERLVRDAVRAARRAGAGGRLDARESRVAAGALAVLAGALVLLALVGPAWLREGARFLAVPWRSAAASPVYAVGVSPGDATIPRGGDQEIVATLRGFAAREAELVVRRAGAEWERVPMAAGGDSTRFAARLFDLVADAEYYVESNGVRSPLHRLTVADLPSVTRIDLEYRWPAYTGRAPEVVEEAGDIAALRGTVVRVRVTPSMAVDSGALVVDGQPSVPLRADSAGRLVGDLRVTRPGWYRVELRAPDGRMVRGSLDYTIDVLDDHEPTVRFRTPGRDVRVTSLEEVFTEVVADDDYGIASLDLVYAVNGGEERRVVLRAPGGRAPRELSAGHTFFLEEHALEPGDVVSYWARATDADRVSGPKTATTDIYFMTIRPFGRDYRQAEQSGGGGGEGESPSALSQRQREIVAATFKTVRDSAGTSATEMRENLSTLVLAQGELRGRVEQLATQLRTRGVLGGDSTMRIVAEELPKAAEAMREAERRLAAREPDAALPAERTALQHLQRAEAAFREAQVSMGGQQQGGGQGASNAEDLADLFELEVDRLRNQYETPNQSRPQQQREADAAADEALERLRALAARQQQENERARRRAEALRAQGGGAAGGDAQRQLAEETEQLARRLERLAREERQPEMQETARRLREAAESMRRSATGARDGGASEGASALERIEEARRLLERARGGRLERDAEQARAAARELAERQRDIAEDVQSLGARGAERGAETRRIQKRKDALADDVSELGDELDRLSREARREQPEAARRLQEAGEAVRQQRLPEKLRFSKGLLGSGNEEYARNFEEQIGEGLDDLARQVDEAAGAVREREDRRADRALEEARELVRGVESLQERSRQRGEQGEGRGETRDEQPGQQGAPGRPGESGRGAQPGQPGERGQPGQPGQQEGAPAPGGPGGAGQPGGGGRPTGAAMPGGRGEIGPDEARQLAREYRERREAAEALGRRLEREGVDAEQLRELIAAMRRLESARAFEDPQEVARLQAAVVEGAKAFEFALRRQIARDGGEGPRLGGSTEVPAGYRELVEEYFRSLSRGRGTP
ncbi:MAG TPA: DUF4175 family protein [Gemmatimonadaceae bacterium]